MDRDGGELRVSAGLRTAELQRQRCNTFGNFILAADGDFIPDFVHRADADLY
ncbi:MAG TPA: hypothetical protein VFL27_04860 [Candidatus Dormibacteraeota bacterium]|nr:hypothetical protein [Candidatus Dormibacteraeota bacterium]